MKRKLLLVANRLPIRFEETEQGLHIVESEGGLATGLASLKSQYDKEWVGWPGIHVKNKAHQKTIAELMDTAYHPVFLNKKELELYYMGFSNETIWPLFHYFMEFTRYDNEYWKEYQAVNQKFCDKVVEIAAEDDIIWVHDYHLMLLPAMLRERLKTRNPIGFFLHIPFVSYELFRTLPWRRELLEGMLGADLLGFHTFEYMRHFLDTTYRILGYENRLGAIQVGTRQAYVDTIPMGISFEKFNKASESDEVISQLGEYRKKFGHVKLVLSVDRLDYTKGILNRLKAFDSLLSTNPELKEKVSFIMLTVPSRDNVHEYKHLKEEVDEMVGNINGRYSTLSWTPVHYFYRSISFEQLVALYNLADIGLVTPLRDGMNLVAKEYVASKNHGNGVLILSEMAGAAIELEGALRINPNDREGMAEALYAALNMDEKEQEQRLKKMQQHVRVNSVEKWAADFTSQLSALYEQAKKEETTIINGKETAQICAAFTQAEKRLLLLDYDGTLAPFVDDPQQAIPSQELKDILLELNRHATVVLISGRDHFTMEEWFGKLGLHLVAEHGVWFKENGKWKKAREISSAWKADIHPLLASYVEKTPGSFIEEKNFSLVFHYRRADSWLAEIRVPQLMNALVPVCSSTGLNVLDGNKAIEVRLSGIDKGSVAYRWFTANDWDFVMAIGDDRTDEDMFAVMPEHVYTIKVGSLPSAARMRLKGCDKVKELLNCIITCTLKEKAKQVIYKQAV